MDSDKNVNDALEHNLKLRPLKTSDYVYIKDIMDRIYHIMGGGLPQKKFDSILKTFGEGQICIEDNGRVVAAAFAVIVDYDQFGDNPRSEW
jgi:hypothetical protein